MPLTKLHDTCALIAIDLQKNIAGMPAIHPANEIVDRSGQVVLAGLATSAGVVSTARNAHDLGFNVTRIADAMTDRYTGAHRHCVEKIFLRLAEKATTADVLKLLRESCNAA